MTKREEIRLEVAGKITDVIGCRRDKAEHLRTEIIDYLHSQGVVIRVKCPDCVWSQFEGEAIVGMTPCYHCNSTGYIIEPLVIDD